MSSKFFTNKHDPKVDPKATTKNGSGNRTNVKKITGIRKTGRGK
jgi:hypothetical protein